MRDESEIRDFAILQERKAAKAKSKEKAARQDGAIAQADAYGVLASAYWREANLLRWALGDYESPGGKGCCAHREPEPRRLTVGDCVRQVCDDLGRRGWFAIISHDSSLDHIVPYQIKYADGVTRWMCESNVAPATKSEYDAAVAAYEGQKSAEAKRAEEDALIGRHVVRVTPFCDGLGVGDTGVINRKGECLSVDYEIYEGGEPGFDRYTGDEPDFFLVPEGDDPEPYAKLAKAAYEAARHA